MAESIRTRLLLAIGVLAGGVVLLHTVTRAERQPLHQPLGRFPLVLDGWQGTEAPMDARIVEAVGVDDYLSRIYKDPSGNPVQLYIGYYGSQRAGDTIHSPRNCLPGAGWEPVRTGELHLPLLSGGSITVNDYLIRKGADMQLVFYWYQARGRTIPNEYAAKLWMVQGALTRNRTDAALVRVLTPAPAGESQARERATDFVRLLYPHLKNFIPD